MSRTRSPADDVEPAYGQPIENAALAARLGRVRDTWADADPLVLVFPGETTPVVADVDGEWRYLSDRLDAPRVATELDIEVATFRRGDPSVERLSDHDHRFGRADFEPVPGAEAGGDPGDAASAPAGRVTAVGRDGARGPTERDVGYRSDRPVDRRSSTPDERHRPPVE